MFSKTSQLKKTALVSALMLATGVEADTINVDGTICTLADAITAANTDAVAGGCTAGSGTDILELPVDANLTANSLINSEITINGNGSTVDGGAAADWDITDTVFNVDGGLLTMNDIIVTNGSSPDLYNNGGGVACRSGGGVYINHSTITSNNGFGVGLFNCTATIVNSQISENTAFPWLGNKWPPPSYFKSGAGLVVYSSTVNVENTTISNNLNPSYYSGGGIFIDGRDADTIVTISNSTVSGNEVWSDGAGIYVNRWSSYGNNIVEVILSQVTVTSNVAGGSFGGILNMNNGASTLITISQSIITGNATSNGAFDSSAEIFNVNGGNMQVDDFNLFGYANNSGVNGVTLGATDLIPSENLPEIIDTNLTDNGGFSPTHALVPGSPAIDFIPSAQCASLTDQTGKVRPIDGDIDGTAHCDIGAFEVNKPDLIFESGFD